jgi:hypothetical protein
MDGSGADGTGVASAVGFIDGDYWRWRSRQREDSISNAMERPGSTRILRRVI